MADLIMPSRYGRKELLYPSRQPVGAVVLDKSHRLAGYCIMLWWGKAPEIDFVSKAEFVLDGAPVKSPTFCTFSADTDNYTILAASQTERHKTLSDTTVISKVRMTGSASTRVIIDIAIAGETEATNARYKLNISSADKIAYAHEYGAGINQNHSGNAQSDIRDGTYKIIVGTRKDEGANSTVSTYYKGAFDASASLVTPTGGGSGNIVVGSSVFDTDSVLGDIEFVMVFDYCMSAAEVASMSVDPYQILRPA